MNGFGSVSDRTNLPAGGHQTLARKPEAQFPKAQGSRLEAQAGVPKVPQHRHTTARASHTQHTTRNTENATQHASLSPTPSQRIAHGLIRINHQCILICLSKFKRYRGPHYRPVGTLPSETKAKIKRFYFQFVPY